MPWITQEIRAGAPYQVGDHTITPLANVFRIQIPHLNGGLIWNRPAAVVVQGPDGCEQTLPVQDVTRLAIWALFGASLLAVTLAWLTSHRR